MSISAVSSDTAPDFQVCQSASRQRKQDFQALASSLESGNLGGAQQAYSDLAALSSASTSGSTQSSATAASSVQQDYAALGKALGAGNLAEAQQDFTKMQSDMKTAGFHGRHHHHPSTDPATAANTSSAQDTAGASNGSTSITGAATSLISAFASATPAGLVANALSLLG
jgi:hypothetical protein